MKGTLMNLSSDRFRARLFFVVLLLMPLFAAAQSAVTGDIAGNVSDPSGALVPGANVSARNTATGLTFSARTSGTGTYRISAMQPGMYVLTVTAGQMAPSRVSVSVSNGQVSSVDVKLGLIAADTSISVNGAPPLLQQDSGNIATTLTQQQLDTVPNPGQSLTNLTQTMPGTTMVARTTGTGVLGYGSTFGVPANSNVYSVDGGKGNDPVTNGPLDGALNTLIGAGDIQEVTVTTIGNAEYGFLVGAQIDAITKSGSNQLHGDAYYGWNGRAVNANSYFNKHSGVARSFDNVNQVQTAVGGPIVRNKTFFFADYEYYSILLPTSTAVYIPSSAFETATLASVPASETSFYKQMFNLYNAAPGAASAVPLVTGGVMNPNINSFRSIVHAPDSETYGAFRIDQIINPKDSAYVHVKIDRGLQTAYIDTISSAYNVPGHVPITQGELEETHIFGPTAVNQFTLSGAYYNEIFPAPTAGLAAFPLTLSFGSTLPLTTLGGADSSFPEGHRTFNFLIRETFAYQRGKHSLKAGIVLDHSNVSDADIDTNLYPSVSSESLAQFQNGVVGTLTEAFPKQASVPLSFFNLSPFVEDSWKLSPDLTINAGIRLEHFANPVCKSSCISHLANLNSVAGSSTTPYNQLIAANQRNAFPGFQAMQVAPRVGFAWSPPFQGKKTVIRGAYGLYVDAYSAYITEGLLGNVPQVASFTTTSGLLDPAVSGSAVVNVQASNAAFASAFTGGGSYTTISTAVKTAGGSFSAPSFSTPQLTNYPIYHEFDLGVQQEVTHNTIAELRWVGDFGYNELLRNSAANAYNPVTAGVRAVNFAGLPAAQPNPSFGVITTFTQGGFSNYNGLLASLVHRSKYVTAQVNYTWSHALDVVSNGGRFKDNSLAIATIINPLSTEDNYGNADYDVRQNFTANYVLTLPYFGGPKLLTNGWQLAGTFFANSGYPFSVTDSTTASNLSPYRYSGTILAQELSYKTFKCGRSAVSTSCLGAPATATSNGTYFATATGFGSQRRNQFYGPNFFDADLSLFKTLRILRNDRLNLKLGAQFYNVLNHANFSVPSNDVRSSTFGTITSTVTPPVNLLGSNLGGDASPRMIEFTGKLSF